MNSIAMTATASKMCRCQWKHQRLIYLVKNAELRCGENGLPLQLTSKAMDGEVAKSDN